MLNNLLITDVPSLFKNRYGVFNTLVSILGSFRFSDQIPTAAVAFNDTGKCVQFLFNETFFRRLSSYEVEYVIAHECLHVYFEHGIRGLNSRDADTNIAMDIVINETLDKFYGFERGRIESFEPHYIDNTFDEDENILPDMMFEYYLRKLKERKRKYRQLDCHDFLRGQGKVQKSIDSLSQTNNPFQMEGIHKRAGNNSKLEDVQQKLKFGRNRKLAKLVTKYRRLAISEVSSSQWVFPNRRLSEVDFLLPQEGENIAKTKSMVNIAFFADCSGSCMNYAQTFYNTLFSLPQAGITCRYFLFDTTFVEIKKGMNLKYGGGTDFRAIETAIEESYKNYPDLVFVMTDGQGSHTISPKNPERWNVFITPKGNYKMFNGVKKFYEYEDYKA